MLYINETPARWIIQFRVRERFRLTDHDAEWTRITVGIGPDPITFDEANDILKSGADVTTFEYRAVLVTEEGEQVSNVHYLHGTQ